MAARLLGMVVICALLVGMSSPVRTAVAASPTAATAARGPCPNPPRPTAPALRSGALAMYCVPPNWNGDLVVWAHGYVDITQPLGFYNLSFPDGSGGTVYLPDVVEALGFAFATTSYRTNGLAITQGVQDVEELVDQFSADTGEAAPTHTYQTGASEGGLISVLLAEQSPQRFSGALAACGPIGDFQLQTNYIGDMRAVFDYYFPGVLPGPADRIPKHVIAGWNSQYKPAIQHAIDARPDLATQLYKVAFAPAPYPTPLDTIAADVLWYNVFGTNDAVSKFGGNPYDNTTRVYFGSNNDLALNEGVNRYREDPTARVAMSAYDTTGRVNIPVVTLHTTGDDVIPFWHEILYFLKVAYAGNTRRVTQIPVEAFGHCNFTLDEVLGAFALLVIQSGASPVPGVQPANPSPSHSLAPGIPVPNR
jgi:pimeloyl-ACP methyl ester carboxylesterase